MIQLFLARGKYLIVTNACIFLLQVVQPMWPATENNGQPFLPYVQILADGRLLFSSLMCACVCYLWPAESILFLVAWIAWAVCNWMRFSCSFSFCQCPKAFILREFLWITDPYGAKLELFQWKFKDALLHCSSILQYSPVISSILK